MESLDNAGVYRLRKDLAIIQTVDFFTPIVDDPFVFGQIAVSNSLSDIYTMGGRPVTALNLVSFPIKKMPVSVLREIMRGGVKKLEEAGVILLGGHSIDDPEMKYGLSVTGLIHPNRVITNGGARPKDKLILTKSLGTGIISTALKRGVAGKGLIDDTSRSMAELNKKASEMMLLVGVHSCTDITGFGFLGHIIQMAKNSSVCLNINSSSLPYFPEALEFAAKGMYPGGLSRNRDFYQGSVEFSGNVPQPVRDLLFDPQTSGGLLISVSARKANRLLHNLKEAGISTAAIVGEVSAAPAGIVQVN